MIKHILADGRTLDSIEGFRLPYTDATAAAYRLIAGLLEGGGQIEHKTMETRYEAARTAPAAH